MTARRDEVIAEIRASLAALAVAATNRSEVRELRRTEAALPRSSAPTSSGLAAPLGSPQEQKVLRLRANAERAIHAERTTVLLMRADPMRRLGELVHRRLRDGEEAEVGNEAVRSLAAEVPLYEELLGLCLAERDV